MSRTVAFGNDGDIVLWEALVLVAGFFAYMSVIFVPIQMVFGELKFAKSCCEPSEAACRGAQRACAVDLNLLWGARGSDCCASSTTCIPPPMPAI